MSKRITDEKLNVEMSINGINRTQAEISKIQTSVRNLKNENDDLAAAKRKLLAEGKRESQQYKDLTKRQQENRVAIDQYIAKQKGLEKQLGLTGMTVRQLTKHQQGLRAQMDSFVPNTPEWNRLNRELQETDRRLESVRNEMRSTGGVMSSMKKQIGGLGTMFLGGAGIMAAWQGMKRLVAVNAELSDAQANVQKTTGLSTQQINGLTKSLKGIDTRTPINELLALAEEAGRLGKEAPEDIMGFVRTADMIRVALGDDLKGDINENVQLIGKLSNQYGVAAKYGVDFGRGMEMIGSAINEVAASGANQADFLVDYMKRLVGVSAQTTITADQQLGFAAALDEAGQSVEVSGTTMSRVIMDMYKKTGEYAKIAKMDTQEFSDLLKTDANEALLLFLEGLNGNGEGLEQMAAKMDDLKLKGARSVAILATLAANTDLVRKRQEIANKAIEEGTSLSEEFNVKNANLAGNLEKIGNSMSNYFKNSALTGWLTNVTGGIVELNRNVHTQSDMLREQQLETNILIGAITSLNDENDARRRLLDELQKSYPDFLDNIDVEKVSNSELKDRLSEVNDQYRERIKLMVLSEDQGENVNKLKKLQREELDHLRSIESFRISLNITQGETLEETMKNAREEGKLSMVMQKNYDRILKIRQSMNDITEENIELQKEMNALNSEKRATVPNAEKPVPDGLTEEEKRALEEAEKIRKKEAEKEEKNRLREAKRIAKQYKNKEEQLISLLEEKRQEREIAQLKGIEKELAQVDEKYRREIHKAEGHSERIKELEILRDQEKNDLKLKRQEEYLKRVDEIEEENRKLREEAELEREVAAADTQLEKDELRLEHARNIALEELEITKSAELAKVDAVEGAEKLKAAIREHYSLEADKLNRKFDEQEKNLRKGEVKWAEKTEEQKSEAAIGAMGLISDAYNEGSDAWKATKIAETIVATQLAAQNAYTFMAAIGGPVLGAVGAAAALAAGMKKVNAIRSTEVRKIPKPSRGRVKGYESGLYPDYLDVTRTDGKRFRARNMARSGTQIVNEPTYFSNNGGFLTGEGGPELIVDSAVYRRLDPTVIDHIMNVRRNVTGYEQGRYPSQPRVPTGESQQPTTDPELKALLQLLNARLSGPIQAQVRWGYDEVEENNRLASELDQSNQNGNLTS